MKSQAWKTVFVVLLLVLVMACGGTTTTQPETVTQETSVPVVEPAEDAAAVSPAPEVKLTGETLPINAKVVFTSNRSGNFEIYSSNLDGSDVKQLTNDPGEDAGPDVSPDGSMVAFYSTRSGNKDIYIMNIDGSNLVQVTNDPADDQMPAWSPNGKVIAFTSNRGGNADIYLFNLENTQTTPFTNWPSDETHPTWSPVNPEIAFMSTKDGDPEIYVLGLDQKLRQLTNNNYYDADPDWSPNGRFIVFSADPERLKPTDKLNTNLYLVGPDGLGLQQVTSVPGFELEPTWSPDSNYLLFTSNMSGNVDVFMLEEDGTFFRVTTTEAVDSEPSWGPISK